MTPQSPFMVVAPVAPARQAELRALLETMNRAPGVADPQNAVLPFGVFEQVHYARLVLLDDATQGDPALYGMPQPQRPTYLALIGECDGPSDACLAAFAQRASAGLTLLFSHCEGFDPQGDMLSWMRKHDVPPAVFYVNRVGRTVRQVKEEHALQRALSARLRDAMKAALEPQRARDDLLAFVDAELRSSRLTLTPPEPTPTRWLLAHLAHAIALPLLGIVLLPLVIVALPFVLALLRRHEKTDPEHCPRPSRDAVHAMQRLEDHDVTNQFTALGAVKPGWFRRTLVSVLLMVIDYACRHVFKRGYLARVQTIHFARWAFIDDKARVVFTSNYDGGHESYMDDFINKVAWGLNLVFSNGFGWPRTDWLIKRGARRELPFKHYQRRHQLPSQVWYRAYPGLTVSDLERNTRIRAGLQQHGVSDAQALAWLRLL